MADTLKSGNVSTKLARIAELAREDRKRAFVSIAQVIDVEWMREAYHRTRKDGAVGVDRQTAEEFAEHLEANLKALVDGLHSGRYKAPPVRRVHIPKGEGKTRPIGIPTFADKVMQRAVAMVLEAIYEEEFYKDSYGFRPHRSAHQALVKLQRWPTYRKRCWVIEADIRSFFDTIDHTHLRSFLDQRVRDGVLRRMVDKWLKAGAMEEEHHARPVAGTPQGGVISPLLANIYLHHVLDRWYEQVVWCRMRKWTMLIRYADDFVLLFEDESDARRIYDVLPKRFAKYGLALHPEKTRLIAFSSPDEKDEGDDGPGSFDFLGFTHYWAHSRKGRYVVKQKTSKSRFSRGLKRIKEVCRKVRHWCVPDQHQLLSRMLRGHYNYYGITGNGDALSRFLYEAERIWGRSLARRNQRRFAWQRFKKVLTRFPLPPARVVHSVVPSESTA